MARLVYLSASTLPAATANSIQVMKTCEALATAGADVTLFATRAAGDPFGSYDCEPRFRLAAYPDRDRFKLPFGLGRRLADAGFARELRRLRPDMLYARSARWLLRALDTVRAKTVAFELHTPPATAEAAALLAQLFATTPGMRVVVITRELRSWLLDSRPDLSAERVLVAPDAADPGLADGPARALPGGGLHLGYVGGLHPGCGLDMLGRAIAGLDGVTLHVVGGTPAEIAQMQAALPADASVVWHGRVPHAEVGPFLRAFDLVVAPYQPDAEGHAGVQKAAWMSPLKIFEAMAAARPILAADLPVLREVLADGLTARLVAPDDPAGWRAAILELRGDAALRQRLATAAQARFLADHSWSVRGQRILRFLMTPA